MKFSKQQTVIIGAGVVLLIVVFAIVSLNLRRGNTGISGPFTLNVWGIDPIDAIQPTIDGYRAMHPGSTVNYKQVPAANYDAELLDAMAAGQAPDVLYIGNHELPKMQNKLVALSPVDFPNFTITQFRADFPQAAEEDLVSNGQIYAMPLYMDTLALIYNRDLFDQAGIVSPPATWSDFQTDVAALRQVGANGQIARAAAAIGGTGKTVDHATDILELLMMQNGATMTSADLTTATFAQTTQESGSSGATAFNFYLQFANATSPYYTWNEGQTDSIDSFAAGQTAMIFDYQSALATIKNKAPFLNFAVAPMPQVAPDNAVNFPSYEALAVSKQSKDQFHAWDFAIYAATNGESATMYAGHRPPALRAAIAVNENNPDFGIFAKQALTARSWYEADDAQINDIMNGAIRDVLVGAANSNTALGQAEAQVSQLMKGNQ